MSKIQLSIIIVSFNTKQITKNCIDSIYTSLSQSKLDFEIIVFDNASSDDSVIELKKYQKRYENFHLIESKKNIGFGRGNNQAVQHAHGEYILLLNSDTVVLDNAIEKLYNFADDHSMVHFVGGKLFNKDMTPQPSCGPYYSLPVIFGALFLKGDYWGLTRQSPTIMKQVGWASGACILTKKEYFQQLGGFDEKIFMYMEEVDLLRRASLKGLRTYFYPDAHFIHLGSASSGGKTFPILQVYKGFMYLYKKHATPFALSTLKTMLKLKAEISIFIGRMGKNRYLIDTYEEAKKLVAVG